MEVRRKGMLVVLSVGGISSETKHSLNTIGPRLESFEKVVFFVSKGRSSDLYAFQEAYSSLDKL